MTGNVSREPGLGPDDAVLHERSRPLDAIFAPRTIAVVGATEKAGSVGRTILENLIGNPFGRRIFPVNPNRPDVLGIKAYARPADVPGPIDLAVVVRPTDATTRRSGGSTRSNCSATSSASATTRLRST
jgi:acetyltransferase